jgi:hypothetical protein
MENPEFKRDFITRFADLLNTTFHPSNTVARINHLAALLDPEMAEHIRRWRAPTSLTQWRSNVQYLRDFANNRPQYVRQHLIQRFGLGVPVRLALAVSNPDHGDIKINTIAVSGATNLPWTGLYFKGHPVTVTAQPKPGYSFAGWRGILGVRTNKMTLLLNGDQAITAVFALDPAVAPMFTSITRLANGNFQLRFTGLPDQSFQLQASTNLIEWATLSLIVTGASGESEIEVPNEINSPSRFYRLRSP